jgi:hypothetical protein
VNTNSGPVLSDFQVAELCGIAQRIIAKFSDSGRLPYVRNPETHKRQFKVSDVIEFMRERKFSVPVSLLEMQREASTEDIVGLLSCCEP